MKRLARIGDAEFLSKMRMLTSKRPYLGFYSSLIDRFIDDPALMLINADDHAFVRGHGCFDTAAVVNGKLYRFEAHFQRMLKSAHDARVTLPFEPDVLREKIIHTIAMTGERNANARYFLSAGPGNFTWLPYECQSAFYVVVLKDDTLYEPLVGNIEVIAQTPMKSHPLTEIKTNNYLMNVLMAMESFEQGGKMGIWVDPSGYLAEGCVANVITVKGKTVRTPPFDNILRGCTARRVLEFANELKEKGDLESVEQRPVHIDELYDSDEIFMCSADFKFRPVTTLKSQAHPEGYRIGSGEVGPVTNSIVNLIREDAMKGEGVNHMDIPYELYENETTES